MVAVVLTHSVASSSKIRCVDRQYVPGESSSRHVINGSMTHLLHLYTHTAAEELAHVLKVKRSRCSIRQIQMPLKAS